MGLLIGEYGTLTAFMAFMAFEAFGALTDQVGPPALSTGPKLPKRLHLDYTFLSREGFESHYR